MLTTVVTMFMGSGAFRWLIGMVGCAALGVILMVIVWAKVKRLQTSARAAGIAEQQRVDLKAKENAFAQSNQARADVAALGSSDVVEQLRAKYGRPD